MSSSEPYAVVREPGTAPDAPVLFLLHGTGGDEHQFMDLARDLAPGARRVGVRGDVSEMGALRYFRRLAEGQYDMPDLERATAKMARFMADERGAARAAWALGYSNGANILASVLFSGGRIDRAVLMHPLIPFTPPPQPALKGAEVLLTAGRRDPIAPFARSEALAAWFEAQGALVELVAHDGGHEIRREELVAAQAFLSKAEGA